MNYLSHILLSGSDKDIQLGNFIGDAVKGSSYKDYPPGIQKGVLLHRKIDDFTDNHPLIRETVQKLRPYFGRYSAVLLDIFFDYILASRFQEFSAIQLRRFTRRFYLTMIVKRRYLPARIKRFMWHFIATDRLGSYRTKKGIRQSLEIMVHYHRIDISVDSAMEYLDNQEQELFKIFRVIFAELTYLSQDEISKTAEA